MMSPIGTKRTSRRLAQCPLSKVKQKAIGLMLRRDGFAA